MSIEHLRLSKYRGIASVRLTNLGRINVVCGKNNSGKSSVLAATATPDRAERGFSVSADDLENLSNAVAAATSVHPNWSNRRLEMVRLVVSQIFQPGEVWYQNDGPSILSRLYQGLQQVPAFRDQSHNTHAHEKACAEACARVWKTALIPAKRQLQEVVPIGAPVGTEPTGAGVVGRLFHMGAKQPTHPERVSFERLKVAFTAITRGLDFGVFSEDSQVALKFNLPGRGWVPASECGLGLQDLLVILFFAVTTDVQLLCVEEPENHLHPEMQKRLLRFLRDETQKQYFLATHSNAFLSAALVDRVFLAISNGERIEVRDDSSRADILSELGYDVADNLVSDVIVLVEGPTDMPVIEELLQQRGTLSQYSVRLWPLGGDTMQYVDLSVLKEHKKVIALIDRDPGSAKARERFVRKCHDAGVSVTKLKRRGIENYFPLSAIRAVFKGQVPDDLTQLDPNASMEKQLGFSVKSNNRKIARQMSLDDVEGTDLGEFIKRVDALCMA